MWRLALTSLLWVAASCGAAPDSDGWSGRIRQVGGASLVQNPREAIKGRLGGAATVLWSAPSPEQESKLGPWEEPVAVRAADTVIYVLDRMGHRVHVVPLDHGVWNRSFGSEGSGPGELREPFGLATTREAVVVGNGGKATLDFFSRGGEYERSLRLGQPGFAVHSLGRGQFLVNALLGSEGGWHLLSTDGETGEFLWPEWISDIPDVGECARVFGDAEGVYRVDCTTLAFQIVDHHGRLRREITVDRAAEAASDQQLQEHLRRVRATMRESGLPAELIERQVAREEERLRHIPRIRGVRRNSITGEFAVWEQQPDELGSGPAILHVFDADGRYLSYRQFDAPWVDFDLNGAGLYALERDQPTELVRLVAREFNWRGGSPTWRR